MSHMDCLHDVEYTYHIISRPQFPRNRVDSSPETQAALKAVELLSILHQARDTLDTL